MVDLEFPSCESTYVFGGAAGSLGGEEVVRGVHGLGIQYPLGSVPKCKLFNLG